MVEVVRLSSDRRHIARRTNFRRQTELKKIESKVQKELIYREKIANDIELLFIYVKGFGGIARTKG